MRKRLLSSGCASSFNEQFDEIRGLIMALSLARQILILFMMMFGGFILVKLKILPSSGSKILSLIIIYLITPCVLISSFQVDLTEQTRSGFLLCLFTALLIHVILFLATAILDRFFYFTPIEKTSVIYSNSGNLIFPLITALLGDEWVIYASAFLCVQTFFVWTHCPSVIEGRPQFNLKKILANVNIIAIFIGVILLITGITLPSVINDAMDNLSSTIGPLAMIMIGMILAEVNWKETLGNKRLYLIAFLRMIIIPFLIMLVLKLSPLAKTNPSGTTLLFISLLGVSTPTAAAVTQIAQLYDKEVKYASAINAVTTLMSIVTMPLIIALYYL